MAWYDFFWRKSKKSFNKSSTKATPNTVSTVYRGKASVPQLLPSQSLTLSSLELKKLFYAVIQTSRKPVKGVRMTPPSGATAQQVIQLLDVLSLKAATDPTALLYLAYLHAHCPIWGGITNLERAGEYYKRAFALAAKLSSKNKNKIYFDKILSPANGETQLAVDLYTIGLQSGQISQQVYIQQIKRVCVTEPKVLSDLAKSSTHIDIKLDLYLTAFENGFIDKKIFKEKIKKYVQKSTAKVVEIAQVCEQKKSKELALECYQLAYEEGKLTRTAYMSQLARLAQYLPDHAFEAYIELAEEDGGYHVIALAVNNLFERLSDENRCTLVDLHYDNNQNELANYYHNLYLYKRAEVAKNKSFEPFNSDNFIMAYISFEYLQRQEFFQEGQSYVDQLNWLIERLSNSEAAAVADDFVNNYFCESELEEFHRLAAIFCQLAYSKDDTQQQFKVMANCYSKKISTITTQRPSTAPKPVRTNNNKLAALLKTLKSGSHTAVGEITTEFQRLLTNNRNSLFRSASCAVQTQTTGCKKSIVLPSVVY